MAGIGAPHGVRGEVRLNVFAEDAEALPSLGPFTTGDGRTVSLRSVRAHGGRILAAIDGVTDRDAAAALTGALLYLERTRLPAIEEDDTFYHVDMIGLAAERPDGAPLGRVAAVHDFGAGDILEIARDSGAPVLVPFTKEMVPEVDLSGGRIVVDPPPGLIDET